MIYSSSLVALALSAGFFELAVVQANGFLRSRYDAGSENRNLLQRQDATPTCLDQKSIATGSFSDGQGSGVAGVAAGQSPSETDKANFIHGCDDKTVTNGAQNKQGSCNPIIMGDIPAFSNMVTTILTSPGPGDDINPNTDFTIKLQVNNLNAGVFVNPTVNYYSAPQRLKNGNIIGHVHVTIQDLGGSLTPTTPPDPTTFVHFKGIDDAGDGKGGLTNAVTGGLPPGFYRLCTLVGAANHQPVIMPVAQRGAQDDCTKFTVGQGKGANGGGANNGGNDANAGDTNGGAKAGGNNSGGGKTGGNAGDNNNDGNNAGNSAAGNGNNGNGSGGSAVTTSAQQTEAATTAAAAPGSAQATNTAGGNGGNRRGRKSNGSKGQGQGGRRENQQQQQQQQEQEQQQQQQRRGPKYAHHSRSEFRSRPYVMV